MSLRKANFIVTKNYYFAHSNQVPYTCVYVDDDVVIFKFEYQGSPRVNWQFLKDMDVNDFHIHPISGRLVVRHHVVNGRIKRKSA